jgi:hypothetical protein
MKTKYFGAVAMLVLFGLVEPSSAQFSSGWSAQHKNPYFLAPGEMRVEGGLAFSTTGELIILYDFTFKLAEGSEGIYPAAEVVEIEVPGELNPDGSESSAFVISIPIGSFHEGRTGFFYTWNPPGLKVSQHYESYVWDFVDSDGVRRDSGGVRSFWGYIHPRDVGEVVSMRIVMIITDNRYDNGAAEPAPKFLELLFGGPTLNIGNDGWETRPYWTHDFLAGPYSPPG